MAASLARCIPLVVCTVLVNALSSVASGQARGSTGRTDVEDVFLYRSVRVMQMPVDAQCAEAGFEVRGQGRYEFTVLSVQKSNGELGNEPMNKIGESVMCFGTITDTTPFPFYARYSLNGVTAVGRGECRTGFRDFPEPRV